MNLRILVAVASLSLTAACGSTDNSGTAPCDPACPEGVACEEGVCVPDEPGADAGEEDTALADAAAPPADAERADAGDTGGATPDADAEDAELVDTSVDAEPTDAEPTDVVEPDTADADIAEPDTADAADGDEGDAAADTAEDTADAGGGDAGGEDVLPGDAGDAGAPDADVTSDADVEGTIAFRSPEAGSTSASDAEVLFAVSLEPAERFSGTNVVFESDLDGPLGTAEVGAGGVASIAIASLSVGVHTITARGGVGDGAVEASLQIGVCGWLDAATFDESLPEEWQTYGDATRDARGWLEMTGNIRDRRGAIANTEQRISDGNVRLRFQVATGGCDTVGPCGADQSTGADGFALSIFDVASAAELETIIDTAASGGGLGYGIAGGWGRYTGAPVDGFHIEFDTWYNVYNGTNEFHTDPTRTNHIGITLDGNPGEHVLWAETPTLEDNTWHEIEVTIDGSQVTVVMNGETIIDDPIPGYYFKGGFVLFTGTTGYYSNYHRFDELQVIEDCRVE